MTEPDPAPAPGPSRRSRLRGRLGLIAAALAVAFLALALARGWSQVTAYSWDLDARWLAAACAVLLVFYAATAVGYVAVVASLVAAPPPALPLASSWAVSLLGRYVPGSVVMVVGRVELARRLGVPRRASLAATVYEQALGLGVAAVLSLAFVVAYGNLGSVWAVAAVATVPGLLVCLHPRIFGPVSRWALARAGRPALERLIPARRVAGLVGWYGVTAVMLAVGVWLGVRGVAGHAVGSAPYVGGAFLFAFTVSMVLIVFPSGLGVRDGAFALALSREVPGGVAVALSVSSRLLVTLVELAFVGAVWLWARRR